MRSFAAVFFLCLSLDAQVVVSQVYGGGGNTGASFRNDFVELFNRGTAAVNVTGWTVQYAPASGTSWERTELAGSIAPGQYYLVQESQGAGGTVSLPAPDAAGTIALSATAGKVALVGSATPLSGAGPDLPGVVDFVGYGAANAANGSPAPALTNTTAALRRMGGCADTGNNAADFATGSPTPRNSSSPRNDCAAGPPAPIAVSINRIQGFGSTSPLVGQVVTTTGIVTGAKRNGFFIQNPDSEVDDDPNTSEGLFIFTSTTPPAVAARRNLVRVTGTVAEFRAASDLYSPTLTELTGPEVTLLTIGNPLPAAVTLTPADTSPAGTIEQLERFEGMRVRAPSLTVVGPTGGSINETAATSTSNGVFYGVLSGVPRPFREPGVQVPDPLPEGAPANIVRFDANPERLRVESNAIEVTAGATVTNLVGPLDYAFRTYTIVPDPDIPPQVSGLASATPVPAPAPGEFTVGSFNLQRLYDSADDPAIGEPVVTPAAFNNRLNKASLAIRNVILLSDILGLEEVENLAVLRALAARISADAGVSYQAYLEPGNDPSGINVGLLVKTSRVTVLGVTQEGKDAPFNDRPPLVLRATVLGLPITVIVNHLRSLTDIQDPGVREKRRSQAEFLAKLIQARQSENVISIGDYNSFQFNDGYVDVIGVIKGMPAPSDQVVLASDDLVNPDLTDLIDTLPPAERYSYVFDGNAQVLDHVLVNPNLLARLSRFAYARNNADFPESYRNDPNRPERISDHDMPVAYFVPAPQISAAGVTSAASFQAGPVAPGEIVTLFGAGLGDARVLFDGAPAPVIYASPRQVNTVVPYAVAGRNSTELQIESRGTLSSKVALPVTASAPGIFTLNSSGQGQGAILNQDSTVNGPSNPASRGTIVQVFATGAGVLQPPPSVAVRIGGINTAALYAGQAPSLIDGAFQINARIPEAVAGGNAVPITFTVGSNTSQSGVTLAVR